MINSIASWLDLKIFVVAGNGTLVILPVQWLEQKCAFNIRSKGHGERRDRTGSI